MGRGGSRYGAGRPGWRRKCEHRLGLDIRVLVRRGFIHSEPHISRSGSWQWTCNGEPSGNISLRAEHDRVQLTYNANGQPFDYPVWLERTPAHYGGTRPWFRCPRCGARRAVLYGMANDGRFGCRDCMRLCYASEAEDAAGRMWRKQRKFAARLGAKDRTDMHPPRPKGMHQRTYRQVLERIWACEMWRDDQLYLFMQRHFPEGLRAILGEDCPTSGRPIRF